MKDNEVILDSPQSLVVEMDYEGVKSEQPEQNSNNSESESEQDAEEQEYLQENPEEGSEEQPIQKPRSKRWEKARRDREEKYLLSQALAEEKRRNLELQHYLSRSIDNNTMSRADKALARLEEAERAHAQALESNDALAASKASTALIQANLELERVANMEMIAQEKNNASEINPTAYASTKILSDWLVDNPEFNEDSDSFNPALVAKVAPLIDKLDMKLKKRGQAHLISSPMYYDVIDTIVSQMKQGNRSERPMTAPVSSRSHNSQYNYNQRPSLTEQQKIVAAGCNMSEEQYMNWLKKYEKEKIQQESSRGTYGY